MSDLSITCIELQYKTEFYLHICSHGASILTPQEGKQGGKYKVCFST